MYVPTHFAAPQSLVDEVLHDLRLVDLVTASTGGLVATLLPMLHLDNALVGHVARNNPHWRSDPTGPSLAVVRGPDTYISPNWYRSKTEHGRVVPTWNYVTLHVYGELVVHDDVDWLRSHVRRLTDHHESGRPQPWSIDDAPAKYLDGQLRAIVGLELRIDRIEAKAKLSQNRPEIDFPGLVDHLHATGADEMADAVERAHAAE